MSLYKLEKEDFEYDPDYPTMPYLPLGVIPKNPNFKKHISNSCPGPLKEIFIDEFIHRTSSPIPNYIEERAILDFPGREGVFVDIRFLWYTHYGIGIEYPKEWRLNQYKEVYHKNFNIVYTEDFKFYYVGCDHAFVEDQSYIRGMFDGDGSVYDDGTLKLPGLKRYKCGKCGYWFDADSSD
jgi:hypothetical protein